MDFLAPDIPTRYTDATLAQTIRNILKDGDGPRAKRQVVEAVATFLTQVCAEQAARELGVARLWE